MDSRGTRLSGLAAVSSEQMALLAKRAPVGALTCESDGALTALP